MPFRYSIFLKEKEVPFLFRIAALEIISKDILKIEFWELFERKDFDQLDSAERLKVLEKFIQYLIPRYSPIQTTEKEEEEELKPLVIVLTKEEAEKMGE